MANVQLSWLDLDSGPANNAQVSWLALDAPANNAQVSWLALDAAPASNVQVSWLALDAAPASNVQLSWLALDAPASNVQVSWLALDSFSAPVSSHIFSSGGGFLPPSRTLQWAPTGKRQSDDRIARDEARRVNLIHQQNDAIIQIMLCVAASGALQ